MPDESGAPVHISDFDLIQFADGEMPVRLANATETHLGTCEVCRTRFSELKHGAAAYQDYHLHHLKPSLELPKEWPGLIGRLETLEKDRNRFLLPVGMWWAAAAMTCCGIVIGWFLHREAPTRRMEQVLLQAVLVPTPPHRTLQVTENGHSRYRAAVFHGSGQSGLENTRALFVQANYSWEDPLSARSFAAWRKQLRDKRDQVLSIQDPDGKNRFYRLQTETPIGLLRTAALTLRADTLNPVKGAFRFEPNHDVTIEEARDIPASPEDLAKNKDPVVESPTVVKQVGPEEELLVFAALNAIGADVGEPLTVDLDPSKRHVVVAGLGLPANRERQIREALARIPNVTMSFASAQAARPEDQDMRAGGDSSGNAAPLRHLLEAQAGGAQQFELMADKALDASSTILAQAHALYVLSQKFPHSVVSAFGPPERATLRSLQHVHDVAIEKAAGGLEDTLKPILGSKTPAADETQNAQATSGELAAVQLYDAARLVDASLGRILAGKYSQEAGQSILNKLPDEIQTLESLARSEDNLR